MALPKQVKYLLTTVELPSNRDIKLKFRPFTGEEEKLFLMLKAAEEDLKKIQDTIIQVISNCLIDAPQNFVVKDLCLFDIEWIFLQLHAASIDNTIEFIYNNDRTDQKRSKGVNPCSEKCPTQIKIQFPISDIKVHYPENTSKTIILYDTEELGLLGVKLKYPTAEMMPLIASIEKENESVQLEEITFMCLENFFDRDSTYVPDTKDPNEIKQTKQLIAGFTYEQRKQIKKFFEEMPSIKHSFPVKCPICGFKETITLQGLSDFFL